MRCIQTTFYILVQVIGRLRQQKSCRDVARIQIVTNCSTYRDDTALFVGCEVITDDHLDAFGDEGRRKVVELCAIVFSNFTFHSVDGKDVLPDVFKSHLAIHVGHW